jgi:hypothetical protein
MSDMGRSCRVLGNGTSSGTGQLYLNGPGGLCSHIAFPKRPAETDGVLWYRTSDTEPFRTAGASEHVGAFLRSTG